MSAEAHKLIGISLSKIAQSRASRGGVSLHKNLLVATVLHKARYIFMEEAYQFVHGGGNKITNSNIQDSPFYKWNLNNVDNEVNNDNSEINKISEDISINSTVSENNDKSDELNYELPTLDNHTELTQNDHLINDVTDSTDSSEKLLNDITSEQWRDNNEQIATSVESTSTGEYKNPPSYQAHIELTYLNLDKNDSPVVKQESNNNTLKRRHSEWEVEEAVLSILPKRSKSFTEDSSPSPSSSSSSSSNSETDFTFLDESDFLSEPPSNRLSSDIVSPQPSMEIDRLSSLVSIFSFANLQEMSGICDDDSKLSSLDQCSTQAKDNSDVLQPMPSFLAMTV